MINPAEAVAAEPKTGVRWKIFLVLLSLVAINYIDRASLSVAMPLIAKDFDLDPAMQGLILSSFFWTYALMQVPGGMMADRFKPRIVQHADDILTVHAVVAAGLGAAFLPWHGVEALGNRTHQQPLSGSASKWPVGICWRSAGLRRCGTAP